MSFNVIIIMSFNYYNVIFIGECEPLKYLFNLSTVKGVIPDDPTIATMFF